MAVYARNPVLATQQYGASYADNVWYPVDMTPMTVHREHADTTPLELKPVDLDEVARSVEFHNVYTSVTHPIARKIMRELEDEGRTVVFLKDEETK